MAEVITKLRVDSTGYDKKIKDAQRSLEQFGIKGTDAGNRLNGLSRILTANIGSLSKFSLGLGAASAALKVAGDAFKSSETMMDSWKGTVEGMQSVYKSFLTSLNTGDFGGFFHNIRNVINAAKEAYDSLDNLGTHNAFAARANAKNRASYSEAVANYKENKTTANADAVRSASDAIIRDLEEQKELTKKAYEDAVRKLALEQGMTGSSVDDFASMFSSKSWADLVAAKAGYSKSITGQQRWNGQIVNQNTNGELYTGGWFTQANGQKVWMDFLHRLSDSDAAAFRFARALNEVSDQAIESTQALGAQEYTLETAINEQRRQVTRILGGSNSGSSSISSSQASGYSYDRDVEALNYAVAHGLSLNPDIPLQEQLEAYFREHPVSVPVVLEPEEESYEELSTSSSGKSASIVGSSGDIVGAISQMASSMETMGVDIPEGITKTISILQGMLSMLSAIQTILTIIETLQSIDNITFWHTGGIVHAANGYFVPGSRNGGFDTVPAMLSPGELVLNQAQQANLASQLSGSGMSGLSLTTEISGENLAIVLDNNNRRRGRAKSVR